MQTPCHRLDSHSLFATWDKTVAVVFTALIITLMFNINQGIPQRYKLAEAIYARSLEPTETQITVHALMMSFGVVVGILL